MWPDARNKGPFVFFFLFWPKWSSRSPPNIKPTSSQTITLIPLRSTYRLLSGPERRQASYVLRPPRRAPSPRVHGGQGTTESRWPHLRWAGLDSGMTDPPPPPGGVRAADPHASPLRRAGSDSGTEAGCWRWRDGDPPARPARLVYFFLILTVAAGDLFGRGYSGIL